MNPTILGGDNPGMPSPLTETLQRVRVWLDFRTKGTSHLILGNMPPAVSHSPVGLLIVYLKFNEFTAAFQEA